MCLSVWYRTYNCTRYLHSANSTHNVTSVREASRTQGASICIFFSLYSICVSPNMGSRTVLHFQCSVGNTVVLLIPCTALRISANASPYGCLGFVINCTLNIVSARGLAHSERQRNVKNVALRSAELHNTKKAIYFPTSKITFIKHPKK